MSESGYIATVGMFDGVHLGHQSLLKWMIQQGRDRRLRTMVITFSNHPLSLIAPDRAPAQIMDYAARDRKILSLGIDRILLLNFHSELRNLTAAEFFQLIKGYGVKVLVLGHSNGFGSDKRSLTFEDYVRIGGKVGIEVLMAPEFEHPVYGKVNSSIVRQALKDGDISKAEALLDAPVELKGKVVQGDHIGRTLGFPTANLQCNTPLGKGVYSGFWLSPQGQWHHCILNIGYRPTVSKEHPKLRVEVNIDGFTGNLYGQELVIRLDRMLRRERQFPSLEALKAQLELDRQEARKSQLPAVSQG